MNISPTIELEQFVTGRIKSGAYQAVSAGIEAALRFLQERNVLATVKLTELIDEIQKGKDSGAAKEIDIEDLIRRGKQRLSNPDQGS